MGRKPGRKPIGERAMTGSERVRRYRARHGKPAAKAAAGVGSEALQAELARAQKRIADLEAQPAAAPDGRIKELEAENARLKADNAKLTDEIFGMQAERFMRPTRPPKPKVEKPPLPPDEERDRIIAGLKTRVRNLTIEVNMYRAEAMKKQKEHGIMSRETRVAIDKVLHPEGNANATAADRDRAVKGWNMWKHESDELRRGAPNSKDAR